MFKIILSFLFISIVIFNLIYPVALYSFLIVINNKLFEPDLNLLIKVEYFIVLMLVLLYIYSIWSTNRYMRQYYLFFPIALLFSSIIFLILKIPFDCGCFGNIITFRNYTDKILFEITVIVLVLIDIKKGKI